MNNSQNIQIISERHASSITFTPTANAEIPMLKIGPDGFWVRGIKVPVDENEGLAVFKAFKQWIVETELRK